MKMTTMNNYVDNIDNNNSCYSDEYVACLCDSDDVDDDGDDDNDFNKEDVDSDSMVGY